MNVKWAKAMENLEPVIGKEATYEYYDISQNIRKMMGFWISIIGQTGHGKSVVANHILHALSDKVLLMEAFTQTATDDEAFPITKYTTTDLIYNKLDTEKINQFCEIATKKKAILNHFKDFKNNQRIVKTVILPSLKKDPSYKRFLYAYKIICGEVDKYLKIKKNLTNDKKLEKETYLASLYKTYFFEFKKHLRYNVPESFVNDLKLNYTNEFFTICSSDLKLPIALFFNDLGKAAKRLDRDGKPVMERVNTAGRHIGFTVLYLMQDLTQVDPDLRLNAKFNIFITVEAVEHYLKIGKMPSSIGKKLREASKIFIEADRNKAANEKQFWQIIYNSHDNKVYYTRADNSLPLKFVGLPNIKKILRRIEKKDPLFNNDFKI